jgi:cytosine/adenosine deaminase-related metal-dependent hydrolase
MESLSVFIAGIFFGAEWFIYQNSLLCSMVNGRFLAAISNLPLYNSHTHIGDSFISLDNSKLYGVAELVGPGGLKHRLLQNASAETIIHGMKKALRVMLEARTSYFCDFREGGIDGINCLKNAIHAMDGDIRPIILSRPSRRTYEKEEVDNLLKKSDGLGISSVSDWEYPELQKLASHSLRKKKLFALHASERIKEPVDLILDLKPTFLVHMVNATNNDLEVIADNNIPIVVCPRANAFYGLRPNIGAMQNANIDLLLGTDNAMIASPDIIQEAFYVLKHFDLTINTVVNMISSTPRKYLNVA